MSLKIYNQGVGRPMHLDLADTLDLVTCLNMRINLIQTGDIHLSVTDAIQRNLPAKALLPEQMELVLKLTKMRDFLLL